MKNHEIRIKVSKEELEIIKKKADQLGLHVSTYLRTLGLTSKHSTQSPTELL